MLAIYNKSEHHSFLEKKGLPMLTPSFHKKKLVSILVTLPERLWKAL